MVRLLPNGLSNGRVVTNFHSAIMNLDDPEFFLIKTGWCLHGAGDASSRNRCALRNPGWFGRFHFLRLLQLDFEFEPARRGW
jgi:hypothetical protein